MCAALRKGCIVQTHPSFTRPLPRALHGCILWGHVTRMFNEFGADGGSAAKTLARKLPVFMKHFTTHMGFQIPEIEIQTLVAGAITLKGIGSLLFIFDNMIGAFLLILHQLIATPILYDFYNYDMEKREFTRLFAKFTENLALLGGLLFFVGMKTTPRRSRKKQAASKFKKV